MKKLVLLLCSLFFMPTLASANTLPEFAIMTEDWAPYQFEEDHALRGIAVDLVVEMLDRAGSTQTRDDIQMLPWSRAYRDLQNKEHTLLFSMTRSPERENLFRWVGPLFHNTTYLIANKKDKIKINSPDDLKEYRFGTIIDDASELFLLRLGLNKTQFTRNTKSLNNLRMLHLERLDMIASGWEAFVSDAKEAGYNQNNFEKVYSIDSSDVSIAFHRDTPDWIIQKFQKALDDIKAEGMYDRILETYKAYERDE